jgi:hypothetical protein
MEHLSEQADMTLEQAINIHPPDSKRSNHISIDLYSRALRLGRNSSDRRVKIESIMFGLGRPLGNPEFDLAPGERAPSAPLQYLEARLGPQTPCESALNR